MRLSECLETFILEQNLKGNTPITIRNYTEYITRFIEWLGDKPINTLNIKNFNDYHIYLRNTRKIKDVTIKTYLSHIATFIRFCEANYNVKGISDRIILPHVEKPIIDVLRREEIEVLLNSFSKRSLNGIRNYCICVLMLDCGLRLNEVVNLKISDVYIEKGYIKVYGKGRKERFIPIYNNTKKALLKYIIKRKCKDIKCDTFFLNKEMKPIQREGIKSLFARLKRRTGIARLHPHLLRHTYATNYLLYGYGDVYTLSLLMGHTDVKTTMKYVQIANFYKIMENQSVNRSYLDNNFYK